MNREFITRLYFLIGLHRKDSCADDKALYVEVQLEGVRRYIKLVPIEVTAKEYDTAWDYSRTEGDK